MNRLGNRKQQISDFFVWYSGFKRKDTKNHYIHIRTTKNKEHSEFANVFDKRCAYCGMKYELGKSFNIDHFKPMATYKNLEHDISNFVYSCRACNSKKGDIVLDDDLHPVLNLARYYYRNEIYKVEKKLKEYESSNDNIRLSIDLMKEYVLSQRHVQLSYAIEEYQQYIDELQDKIDKVEYVQDKSNYIEKRDTLKKVIEVINSRHV